MGRRLPGLAHRVLGDVAASTSASGIDIHTGGADTIFPHHEAEIAQSEGALGHTVVRHWAHGGHLLFGTQKMAKSSRNTWTLDDVEEHSGHPLDFRYLCLTARYRGQLHFNPEALAGAAKARRRLCQRASSAAVSPAGGPGPRAREWNVRFWDAVADDLNTPKALTVAWALVEDPAVPDGEKAWLIREWDAFLGLDLTEERSAPLPEGAETLMAERCPGPGQARLGGERPAPRPAGGARGRRQRRTRRPHLRDPPPVLEYRQAVSTGSLVAELPFRIPGTRRPGKGSSWGEQR